jgi:hypothetical protein
MIEDDYYYDGDGCDYSEYEYEGDKEGSKTFICSLNFP